MAHEIWQRPPCRTAHGPASDQRHTQTTEDRSGYRPVTYILVPHPPDGLRWRGLSAAPSSVQAVNGITLAILAAGGTVIVPLASTVVILLIQRRHDRSEKTDLTAEVQDLRAREQASRDDAVRRSRSTILGDVAQHFAPLLPEFPYNHRDFRWMGECSTGSYSTAWKQAAKSPSSS
jgi:Endonuclease related to archaeal Holliday junction resolvase